MQFGKNQSIQAIAENHGLCDFGDVILSPVA